MSALKQKQAVEIEGEKNPTYFKLNWREPTVQEKDGMNEYMDSYHCVYTKTQWHYGGN